MQLGVGSVGTPLHAHSSLRVFNLSRSSIDCAACESANADEVDPWRNYTAKFQNHSGFTNVDLYDTLNVPAIQKLDHPPETYMKSYQRNLNDTWYTSFLTLQNQFEPLAETIRALETKIQALETQLATLKSNET